MLNKRIKSFKHAFEGLYVVLKEEPNARFHFIASIAVISLGFYFNVSKVEWLALVLSFGFVIVTEVINTSIENLADFVCSERNSQIKRIKDIAAAAVLISSITAIVVGLIIFLPLIFN